MDRRSLLKMFGVAAAAAAVFHPASGDAMPVAPKLEANPHPIDSGVATDADMEAAKPESVYWRWRRRRYWRRRYRRFYWRPRRRYWRRRFYRRRYWY